MLSLNSTRHHRALQPTCSPADAEGDVEDVPVVDLGCGGGVLVAAALMGARTPPRSTSTRPHSRLPHRMCGGGGTCGSDRMRRARASHVLRTRSRPLATKPPR